MRADRKQTILFVIILLVLSMGIGYAFLTTTLSIDGVSDIDSSVWDVHWENVQVSPLSVSGSQVISPATIGNNGTTVSFHVKLNEPGEFYAFSLDAVNAGSLNAWVEDVKIFVNDVEGDIPPYIIYELSSSNIKIQKGMPLLAGTTNSYVFGLGYDSEVTPNNLPNVNESLDISFQITYSQLRSMSIFNNSYAYTSTNDVFFIIGNSLPSGAIYYDDSAYPIYSFANYTCLRHYISNNVIEHSDVLYKIDGEIYYLRGGDGGDAYLSNIAILQNSFGIDNCYSYEEDGLTSYYCELDDFYASTCVDGSVSASYRYSDICSINEFGKSSCYQQSI